MADKKQRRTGRRWAAYLAAASPGPALWARLTTAVLCTFTLMVSGGAGAAPPPSEEGSKKPAGAGDEVVVAAESGSLEHIQEAVNAVTARGGGTVRIPEGDFAFNPGEKALLIPGGVSLIGAGAGRTVLRNTVEARDYATLIRVDGAGQEGKQVRVSGISFIGYRQAHPDIPAGRVRGVEIREVTDFRVDHCAFEDLGGGGVVVSDRAAGTIVTRGVIDNCQFINTSGLPAGEGGAASGDNVIGYGIAVNGTGQAADWVDDIKDLLGKYEHGKAVVFVEDCYFRRWRHCIASNQGAHYVFRYNTIEEDCGFGSIDAHGGGYGSQGVGTRAVEIYHNTLKPPAAGFPWRGGVWLRGGGGVVFGNTVEGYRHFVQLHCEGGEERYWPQDVWVWDNALPEDCVAVEAPGNGRTHPEALAAIRRGCATWLAEGVRYFRHAPHTFTYQPYPYPHPLRGAESQSAG